MKKYEENKQEITLTNEDLKDLNEDSNGTPNSQAQKPETEETFDLNRR